VLAFDRARRTRIARFMLAGFKVGKFGGNWVDGHEMTLVAPAARFRLRH